FKQFRAAIYLFAKRRLVLMQFKPHIHTLSSSPWQHEYDGQVPGFLDGREDALGVSLFQRNHGVSKILAYRYTPVIESSTADLIRMSNICEMKVRMAFQVLSQVSG